MPARVDPFDSGLRFVARYVIATLMIPVGVALGVGGLIQHALRRRQRRAAVDRAPRP